jgi:hypothetical protein
MLMVIAHPVLSRLRQRNEIGRARHGSTHVYVDVNFPGESAGEENE